MSRNPAGWTPPDDGQTYDEVYCIGCSGSGEGMYDGTRCSTCNGSGTEYVLIEPETTEEDEE